MTQREIYAACIYGCLSLLALAFGGLTGLILMNAGFWISTIDLGWVDDYFDQKPETESEVVEVEAQVETPTTEDLPPNVVRLPVREFRQTA